jgi:hypothetical protein
MPQPRFEHILREPELGRKDRKHDHDTHFGLWGSDASDISLLATRGERREKVRGEKRETSGTTYGGS